MTRTSTASQRSIFASVATITTLMKLLVGSVALLFVITANATILGTTGSSPIGIAIDADGNVYTANVGSNNVSKITPDGTSNIFGATGSSPVGIAIDAVGSVYTANVGSSDVSKITPDGTSSILGTTGDFPQLLATDAAGNIYIANTN